jgi:3-phosphoshikimate 1-carboxyvinyltransferase
MSESGFTYPEKLEIRPLVQPPSATVRVPGSKSITNRALVLAALAGRGNGCQLCNILRSEDTEVMIDSLRRLGFEVESEATDDAAVRVRNPSGERIIPALEAELFVGNSGTTMRFLTAMVSLGQGHYRLDGVPRMRERPIGDLVHALNQLEGGVRCEAGGCPPVEVYAAGLHGGHIQLRGDVSSQFLSGLLMAAPLAAGDVTIEIVGPLVSHPYVDMTLSMMRHFGAEVRTPSPSLFVVPGRQEYQHRCFTVEPDASAASYFFATAAITGGRVTVLGLPENSLQGDVRFVDVLAEMGCRVERCSAGITVHGRPLRGIDVDMNDISDTVMTLAAVACFADGPTTIRNVGHIRHKESDRLAALSTELRRLGAGMEERPDGLTIMPAPLHGAAIETYNDHRMAMSLALVGLRVPGVVIKDPGCVAKTYPGFFADLEDLRC